MKTKTKYSFLGSYSFVVDNEEIDLEILNGGIYSIAAFRDSDAMVALSQQVILAPYSLNVFLQVNSVSRIELGRLP